MNYPKDPNALDWGSMSKSEFKRAELHYELADEVNTFVYKLEIDGKVWSKVFDNRNHAESAMRTLIAKGKNVKLLTFNG